MLINDKQVYVGYFLRKHERETALNKTKFNNIYVKNLFESTIDEDLKTIFAPDEKDRNEEKEKTVAGKMMMM